MTWQPIETPPDRAMGVLVYIPMEHTDEVPHGQCYCIQVAFYDPRQRPNPGFYEQGTGHGYYEHEVAYGGAGNVPTHWMPLPEPPDAA